MCHQASQSIRSSCAMALLLFASLAAGDAYAVDNEEGGYVYHYTDSSEERFKDNVYNFLKHFSYNQYYWAEYFHFRDSNSSKVDAMDFSYYSGHGSAWFITMGPGASYSPNTVDLREAGSSSALGWGDSDDEFMVFQSCAVIPSPLETSDWASPWVKSGKGVFDGLHQAIGYRTNSNSGNGISDNYGGRIDSGQNTWEAWFDAVDDERSWWYGDDYPGYASAVMHPTTDGDSYAAYASDPSSSDTSLRIWYQY